MSEDYASNSHKSRQGPPEPEKKIEKIISGAARVKKKTRFQRFKDAFISEDVGDIKSYIFFDVLIPAGKKLISDSVDAVLYGMAGVKRNAPASRISYDKYSTREPRRDIIRDRDRKGFGFDDILLDSRQEAMDVLAAMDEIISAYGMARVADLYELVGITGDHTDNKYGWTDIRNAEAVRVRDGYILKMPKAQPLN